MLELARETARATGRHALKNKHRRSEVHKRLAHDVKLRMDLECEEVARETISAHFPRHAFLGEESANRSAEAGYEWIVDPIDGTINYANDMLVWCTSVAVRHKGETLAGCVFAPELEECYTATRDGAALCNGRAIRPSDTSDLQKSFIFGGLTKTLDPESDSFALFKQISLGTHRSRISGSSSLDICNVARGRGDGQLELDLFLWDVAAAALIAERAGATAEILRRWGQFGVSFLCTNGLIHEPLKKIYEICLQEEPQPSE